MTTKGIIMASVATAKGGIFYGIGYTAPIALPAAASAATAAEEIFDALFPQTPQQTISNANIIMGAVVTATCFTGTLTSLGAAKYFCSIDSTQGCLISKTALLISGVVGSIFAMGTVFAGVKRVLNAS